MSFDTVLIANRGAIACRIIRTLKAMGVRSVAVFPTPTPARSMSRGRRGRAHRPRPGRRELSRRRAILKAARETGAGAIHPGYGFLAENADFAEACAAAGIAFIGPTPDNIRAFGLKHSARAWPRPWRAAGARHRTC
jgi:urea carboxylase